MKIPRGLNTFLEICHFLPTKVKIFLKNAIFRWWAFNKNFIGEGRGTLRPTPPHTHTKLMYVLPVLHSLFIYAQLISVML